MAITWTEVQIELINFDRREVRLTCTIIDDDPQNGSTRTYMATGLADTGAHKIALLDRIWRAYQHDFEHASNLATVIAELEQATLDNLNGRLS